MSTAQEALRPISFNEGVWTREPVSAVIGSDGALAVEAAEGSDWWRDTAYGFRHENGHALLRPWDAGTAIEVTFELSGFTGEFDQAGLAVSVDDEWRLVRVARFPHEHARIGPMICAPTREGLTVRFTRWASTEPDGALHAEA